jgi:hypothetical protein
MDHRVAAGLSPARVAASVPNGIIRNRLPHSTSRSGIHCYRNSLTVRSADRRHDNHRHLPGCVQHNALRSVGLGAPGTILPFHVRQFAQRQWSGLGCSLVLIAEGGAPSGPRAVVFTGTPSLSYSPFSSCSPAAPQEDAEIGGRCAKDCVSLGGIPTGTLAPLHRELQAQDLACRPRDRCAGGLRIAICGMPSGSRAVVFTGTPRLSCSPFSSCSPAARRRTRSRSLFFGGRSKAVFLLRACCMQEGSIQLPNKVTLILL